jgi:hypothetical protein
MIAALALGNGPLGPLPTLVLAGGALVWGWLVFKRHPVNQPWMRILGVVLLAVTLSMVLGFDSGSSGLPGGDLGSAVATRIANSFLPVTVAIVLLWIAVAASLPIATEWFFIPTFLRMQDAAEPRVTQLAPPPPSPYAPRGSTRGAAYADDEDTEGDATPLPRSRAATTVVDEDVVPLPSRRTGGESAMPSWSRGEPERAPARDDDENAEGDAADDANVPWYSRKRARRAAPLDVPGDEDFAADADEERAPRSAAYAPHAVETEDDDVATAPSSQSMRGGDDEPESAGAGDDAGFDLADQLRREFESEVETADDETLPAPPGPRASAEPSLGAPASARQPEFDSRVEPPRSVEPDSAGDEEFADFFASTAATLEDSLAREEAPAAASPPVEAVDSLDSDAVATSAAPVAAAESAAPEAVETDEPDADAAIAALGEAADGVAVTGEDDGAAAASGSPEDALYFAAAGAVVEGQRASISFLQRTLSIGYFQAAKILDRLEKEGVIGPYTGAVSRKVLIDAAEWEQRRSR